MATPIDSSWFHACVWARTDIPEAGTRVYYFPHGHAEQSASGGNLPADTKPFICRVVSVSFFAHLESDEVFVRFQLRPDDDAGQDPGRDDTDVVPDAALAAVPATDPAAPVVYEKLLSQTDVKSFLNVPISCLNKNIFPDIECGKEREMKAKDIHGNEFSFTYLHTKSRPPYRLRPGWSEFVKQKSLVANDTLVFIKNTNADVNQLVFGLRRAKENPIHAFSSSDHVRRLADEVLEAVRKASNREEFGVEYYPRLEFPEFVVKKEVVDYNTKEIKWHTGLKVRVTDVNFKGWVSCYEGSVSSIRSSDNSWPWRMLEVSKDKPKGDIDYVNPWKANLFVDSRRSLTSEESGSKGTNVSQEEDAPSGQNKKLKIFGNYIEPNSDEEQSDEE